MESILSIVDYLWPVAVGALVIFHSWDIRQLRKRIERLENQETRSPLSGNLTASKDGRESDSDFWKRYESTRPK